MAQLVRPHVVRETRRPTALSWRALNLKSRPALKAETVEKIAQHEEGVTLRGNAKLAQVEGFSAAVDGTAQENRSEDTRLTSTKFIGRLSDSPR